MAWKTLTIAALLLSSCQTIEQRASEAAKTQGEVNASIPFPDPPAACIAKIGRVRVGDEPWVITFKRWEITADNRDRQAEDCAKWFADMKALWGK
jgi:hypothetical protein